MSAVMSCSRSPRLVSWVTEPLSADSRGLEGHQQSEAERSVGHPQAPDEQDQAGVGGGVQRRHDGDDGGRDAKLLPRGHHLGQKPGTAGERVRLSAGRLDRLDQPDRVEGLQAASAFSCAPRMAPPDLEPWATPRDAADYDRMLAQCRSTASSASPGAPGSVTPAPVLTADTHTN
jgi:hypothetical protein